MAKRRGGSGPRRPSRQQRAVRNRYRNAAGRFVSSEDAGYARAELEARRKATETKKDKLAQQRLNRAREVYAVREGQQRRARSKGKLRDSYRDSAPKDTYRTSFTRGEFKVTLVRFHGADAIERARDYLDDSEDKPYRRYRINIGTGYGKDAQWVGSKTVSRQEAILYLSRVTNVASAQNVIGTDDAEERELWVEIEIFDYQGQKSGTRSKKGIRKSGATRRKQTTRTHKRRGANKPTHRHGRKNTSKTRTKNQARRKKK